MGMLDGILGQLGGQVDVGAIARQVGIDPAMAEMAVAALGRSHAEPGDTLECAAAKTGLDIGQIGQIAQMLGGTGALEKLSGLLSDNPQAASILNMLDRDGDGNPLDDIAGMASSLFGKK
ncbi:MAG: hypothetical protein ACK4YM_05335 [Novosphingobium sp.]